MVIRRCTKLQSSTKILKSDEQTTSIYLFIAVIRPYERIRVQEARRPERKPWVIRESMPHTRNTTRKPGDCQDVGVLRESIVQTRRSLVHRVLQVATTTVLHGKEEARDAVLQEGKWKLRRESGDNCFFSARVRAVRGSGDQPRSFRFFVCTVQNLS